MRRLAGLAARATLAALSAVVAVATTGWLGERFAFDKLCYQRTQTHGYVGRTTDRSPARLGERVRYLPLLHAAMLDPAERRPREPIRPLPENDPEEFTIIVLGDSFCWGQGIRDRQRWPRRLERLLDRLRPTRVISLCEPGNQLIDYVLRYRAARRLWDVDLYLVALHGSDLHAEVEPGERLPEEAAGLARCGDQAGATVGGVPWYQDSSMAILPGSPISCMRDLLLGLLPAERALYFDHGAPYDLSQTMELALIRPLRQSGRTTMRLLPEEPPGRNTYGERYYVSHRERHASAWANARFAEQLADRITGDPSMGFHGAPP